MKTIYITVNKLYILINEISSSSSSCSSSSTSSLILQQSLSLSLSLARFNVPLDTFLGHFGDGGMTTASARIIAAASAEASSPAQPHSVCGVE